MLQHNFSFQTTKTSWLVVLTSQRKDHNSSLSLKSSSNLELLVNQFNNATPENGNDPEKIASSKYYDIDEMHNIEIPHKNKSLSLFHINACSLNKNFDDLQHLLNCTKKSFDIIAISETRITKQVSLSNNLNLNNYSFEFTPTETSAGGTVLYIAIHLSYKCRNDLNIYKKLNLNLHVLNLSIQNSPILLSESFTDIHPWISPTLIAITKNYQITNLKSNNLFSY